jgi:hypothetical protein
MAWAKFDMVGHAGTEFQRRSLLTVIGLSIDAQGKAEEVQPLQVIRGGKNGDCAGSEQRQAPAGHCRLAGYLAGATMDANGRLELLRPIGMHPAINKTSIRQTRVFNCVPA